MEGKRKVNFATLIGSIVAAIITTSAIAYLLTKDSKIEEKSILTDSGVGLFLLNETNEITVVNVLDGSPADRGKFKSGDKISTIDEKAISTISELSEILGTLSKDHPVNFEVSRENESLLIEITLGYLFWIKADTDVTLDAKCNDKCKCVSSTVHISCAESYVFLRENPDGTATYTHGCTAIGRGGAGFVEHKNCSNVILI